VFVKIIEKTKLPGFRFFRWAEIGARPSQKTASGENAPKSRNLEDQQWVARDTMTGSRE
jgi:hypothetical protein